MYVVYFFALNFDYGWQINIMSQLHNVCEQIHVYTMSLVYRKNVAVFRLNDLEVSEKKNTKVTTVKTNI